MNYKVELGLWVLISLLLSTTGAWLAWSLGRMQSRSADWLRRRLLGSLGGRLFLETVRLLFYVVLPYAAVLRRAVSLVVIGVRGPEMPESAWWLLGWSVADWVRALGQAAGLGALVAVLLALGWLNAARAQAGPPVARGLWPAAPWWITLREVVYNEVHWAFYRAGPLLIFSDAYWAVLVGAAFPWLEWVLDPDWWVQIHGGPRREQVMMQCLWLATSTICFYLARNVWPALALHLILALAFNRWLKGLTGLQDLSGLGRSRLT